MHFDIIITLGLAIGLIVAALAAIPLAELRRAFLSPEGFAGLLHDPSKNGEAGAPAQKREDGAT